MNEWNEYYRELELEDYLSNLYGQKEFLEAVNDLAGDRAQILEVGTGTGTMSVLLSQLGHQVTVLDRDGQVLELAEEHNQKFGGRIEEFIEGDTFDLPFEDDSFDLVFHQGLAEHFNNEKVRKMLEEQLRVAPTVCFSVPNNLYPEQDMGDERLMSLTEWSEVLDAFKLIKAETYSPKIFPKWYLPRVDIQNLFIIER